MKKTILFLLSITFFTAINSMAPFGPIPSGGPGGKFDFPPPPSPEELDKILNSDEFKKALEELEEIFGEMNEDDFKPPQKIEKPKFPEKKSDKKAEKIETLEEKFKNPAQVEEGEQLVKTLSKEKLQAFNYFMDQFENQLQALETKINNFSLGIAFKEELEDLQIGPQKQNYKTITGKIKTEKGIIGSRSLYLKAFYLPSFSEMRKEIIDTVKEVTNINKQIKSVENINEEDQGDKQRKIRPKVKKLFTQKLAQIGDDLKKVATCTQAKAEIERKKQEKEKLGKEAAAKRAKLSKKPGSTWLVVYDLEPGIEFKTPFEALMFDSGGTFWGEKVKAVNIKPDHDALGIFFDDINPNDYIYSGFSVPEGTVFYRSNLHYIDPRIGMSIAERNSGDDFPNKFLKSLQIIIRAKKDTGNFDNSLSLADLARNPQGLFYYLK